MFHHDMCNKGNYLINEEVTKGVVEISCIKASIYKNLEMEIYIANTELQ